MTVRNKANQISALGTQILVLILFWLVDPLRLSTANDMALPAEDRRVSFTWVLFVVALGLIAVGALVFLWTPKVNLEADLVTVTNPFTVVEIPRESVSRVVLDGRYPTLFVGNRKIILWGAERSHRMRLRGHTTTTWESRLQPAGEGTSHSSEGDGGRVTTSVRSLDRLEVIISILWAVLIAVAVARWVRGS